MVEQLGLVTMKPSQLLFFCCASIMSKNCGLTSGMTKGMSFFILIALAFDATTKSFANSGSTFAAKSAGSEENTISTSLSICAGSVSITVMSLTDSGISLFIYQVVASSYFLPADLPEAASAAISKSG